MKDHALPININEILRYIPHRYPFLLIDRILELDPEKKVVALKNVTMNEHFFVGHFEDYPVMPGVLIVEAMAQSAGVLSVLSFGESKDNELYFFASINNAKFKRQVIPGDSLKIEVKLLKLMRGVGKYQAVATVDGIVAAEAELMIAKKEVN
jgi:3-hydroxyacyl-[acyl-carrier-protein] dehydratase